MLAVIDIEKLASQQAEQTTDSIAALLNMEKQSRFSQDWTPEYQIRFQIEYDVVFKLLSNSSEAFLTTEQLEKLKGEEASSHG